MRGRGARCRRGQRSRGGGVGGAASGSLFFVALCAALRRMRTTGAGRSVSGPPQLRDSAHGPVRAYREHHGSLALLGLVGVAASRRVVSCRDSALWWERPDADAGERPRGVVRARAGQRAASSTGHHLLADAARIPHVRESGRGQSGPVSHGRRLHQRGRVHLQRSDLWVGPFQPGQPVRRRQLPRGLRLRTGRVLLTNRGLRVRRILRRGRLLLPLVRRHVHEGQRLRGWGPRCGLLRVRSDRGSLRVRLRVLRGLTGRLTPAQALRKAS
jgi:hypothetical protein